jgi:hypothetical protein
LFVAAFPLGALFAFVFNLLAIRVHARKLLCETKRTVLVRTNGIGIWFNILSAMSSLSVLTNVNRMINDFEFVNCFKFF